MQYNSAYASGTVSTEIADKPADPLKTESLPAPATAYRQPAIAGERSINVPSKRRKYRDRTITVVVPSYNEELLIADTLRTIPDYVQRIYVVNDCSQDNTDKQIEACAVEDSRIVHLCHARNCGVGAAIVTGYRAALEEDTDIVAVMAGDNQMDPAFLPDLLDPIVEKKADYSMGNRLLGPEHRQGMSSWRFFGNGILTLLTKIASGYWQMMDPQNGYTAISRRALETIPLDDIYPRYGYCNDLLVRLNVYGFRVKNVPHPARYGLERSGIRYSTYMVRVSRLLFRDFLWRLKMKYIVMNFHPLVFYYLFGTILSALGIAGVLVTLVEKFAWGSPVLFMHGTLSLVVFTLGALFLLFAMLFDMEQERNGGWY